MRSVITKGHITRTRAHDDGEVYCTIGCVAILDQCRVQPVSLNVEQKKGLEGSGRLNQECGVNATTSQRHSQTGPAIPSARLPPRPAILRSRGCALGTPDKITWRFSQVSPKTSSWCSEVVERIEVG